MKKILLLKIIYFLIFALALTWPMQRSEAAGPFLQEGEQQSTAPGSVRESARVHYARAREYYRRREYKKAKAELEQVLTLNPDHQGARWYLKCVEKELAKFEKTFAGRMEKRRAEKKSRNLKSALNSAEQQAIAIKEKLSQEQARRKQLEDEEAKLLKELKKYRRQTDKIKKHNQANARKLTQLQNEKKRLESELERYKQDKLRQEIKQVQRSSAQRNMRLTTIEAERKRLAEKVKELRKQQKLLLKAKQKAEKEEKLRLKREAKERRREEERLRKEEERKAKEEKLARRRQEKERLQQKRKDEARCQELSHRQEKEKSEAIEEELDRLKVEAEEKARKQEELQLQQKIELHYAQGRKHFQNKDYISARKEFKDILILDPDNQYALNALEKVNSTIEREERLAARKEYEQALRNQFEQKINELNEKLNYYEAKIEEYEPKLNRLEQAARQLESAQSEQERLKAELAELRRQQQAQLKAGLQKYEERLGAVQDKLLQKETKLNEKIKLYEAQVKDLPEPQLSSAEKVFTSDQDRFEQELVQAGRTETKLLELQMKINERLQMQLDEFKKAQAQPLYEQGLAHFKNEKYNLAREDFQKALSVYPDYIEAKRALSDIETQEKINLHLAEGQYYYKEKEHRKAQAEFNQVLALDYKNKQARQYLHKIEKDIKEKERAEFLAEQREKERLEKEKARLEQEQRRAEQRAIARAREEAEKEQARLKKEQERQAREERLAQLKAEKEERLASLKAEKEERLRQKQQAQAQRRELARLEKETAHQLRLENEAKKLKLKESTLQLKAERMRLKEEKLRLKQQAQAQRREQARLREEQERQAREERLAKLKAEKEVRLARKRAEKEERFLLKLEAAAERRKQKRLAEKRKAKEKALNLAQVELLKQSKIRAREEEAARLKAEKEEHLRLKREAEEKRREQARLKKEQERQAREERLVKLKAEKEEHRRLKLEAAAERRKQKRLARERKAKEKALKLAQAELLKQAKTEAQEEESTRLKTYPKTKELEQARLKKEQERQARETKSARLKTEKEEKLAQLKAEKEERLASLKAEKEERLRLKLEAEEKRREQARLREEQVRKAREERLAQLKAEKEARLARKRAEKEERLRLKREAEEKRREQARLKKEQERKAREERLAQLKAEKEERLARRKAEKEEKLAKLRAEEEKRQAKQAQERQRKEQARLHFAQGKIYYYRDDYEQSIKEFEQVLLIDPEYPSVEKYIRQCQKGIEEQREKKLQAKEQEAERLEKTAKLIKEEEEKERLEKIKEFYEKGKIYFNRGLHSEAIAYFEKVIELEGNPRIYYTPQAKEYIERAKEETEEQQKEDAQKIAEEEIERKKVEESQKLKAQQRAEEEATRREEELIRNHYKLGKSYYRQGNYPMAIAELNKIKEINPQHSYVTYAEKYIQKCRRKIIQREESELKAEMKKEVSTLKGETVSLESLLLQARWYFKRADYEQTVKICRAVLELDALNKEARNLLYRAELRQVRREDKQARKEKRIDEKEMMAEVAQAHVLPYEETVSMKAKDIMPIVKIPLIREKLKSPITVDFREVDLTYVLNFLADSCGVNIIPASGVSLEGKKVTIRMKDIPAENALKYILKNQGLTYRLEKDAVWVASPSEMDKEEVESRVYFLNRGSGMFTEFERSVGTGTGLGGAAAISKVTTIKDILEEAVNWPKDSKLVMDERSGALIIANTPSNLQVIEDILYNLDITPVQVLIEARFVELEVTDVAELGIEWQITEDLGDKRRDGQSFTQWESDAGWDFTDFSRATEGLNLTYTGVLTYPQFQTVLHALSETQNAKTLSAPKVTTLNNQMATIKVVDEWIYPTRYEFQVVQSDINGDGDFDDANETKYQNVPVDFVTKDVGILLHVTPNVGADGRTCTLALVPEVSEGTAAYFSYTGSVSLPKFSSRTLSTSVVVNNGDTVVLGGLVKESTTTKVTKIPLLGDIPILGYLFRKNTDSVVRKNLLIFVTASIVSPSGEKIETIQQK